MKVRWGLGLLAYLNVSRGFGLLVIVETSVCGIEQRDVLQRKLKRENLKSQSHTAGITVVVINLSVKPGFLLQGYVQIYIKRAV